MHSVAMVVRGLIKEGADHDGGRAQGLCHSFIGGAFVTADAKPETLVALRPAAVTAEQAVGSGRAKTRWRKKYAMAGAGRGRSRSRTWRNPNRARSSPLQSSAPRALLRPLLRPIEEQPRSNRHQLEQRSRRQSSHGRSTPRTRQSRNPSPSPRISGQRVLPDEKTQVVVE